MSRRNVKSSFLRWASLVPGLSLAAVISLHAAALPHQSQDQSGSDSQSPSVADAARKSREHSKNSTKPSKVITDDDLDREYVKPGAQGLKVDGPARLETQPPPQEAVVDAAAASSKKVDPATVALPSDDAEIAKLKEDIATAEKDADLLRRDLALKQDTYFSNPDYVHNTAGKAALDSQQQEINDKQQEIDRLKAHLATLQAKHPLTPKLADSSTTPPVAPSNPK